MENKVQLLFIPRTETKHLEVFKTCHADQAGLLLCGELFFGYFLLSMHCQPRGKAALSVACNSNFLC